MVAREQYLQHIETDDLFKETRILITELRAEVTKHFGSEDRLAIFEALEFILYVHFDQPRPDGPYINHLLRVTLKLIRDFGVRDRHCIIASLNHDSVEDQAEKVAEFYDGSEGLSFREQAYSVLQKKFGEKVRRLVTALTHPEEIPNDQRTPAEKNAEFKVRIEQGTRDTEVAVIKLADFSDNALRIHPSNPPLPIVLVEKYLPITDVFITRLTEGGIDIPADERGRMVHELYAARERMIATLGS